MPDLNQLLLILHFLGLGIGLSATVVHMALSRLIPNADPAEARGLERLRPVMASVGGTGLLVLWVTVRLVASRRRGSVSPRRSLALPNDL